jgi:starch phosphorylase
MAQLTPNFSADRTVREYTNQHYLPAAASYLARFANTGAVGRQIVDWRHHLDAHWDSLSFGEVKVETTGDQHVFEVQVHLSAIDPKAVQVELYAEASSDGAPLRQMMKRERQIPGASSSYVYTAAVSASRAAADYTARVIPHFDGVAIPLEESRIRWQR